MIIPKGKALIISGGQGSGKTKLAQAKALARLNLNVVVVGEQLSKRNLAQAKALVTENPERTFIFTTNMELELSKDDRRFILRHLPETLNVIVHGIAVNDPMESVGKLAEYLKPNYVFSYGWRLFSVLWHNKKDADNLKKYCMGKVVNIIAHSNGCAIAVEAARQGLVIDHLVCISPALRVDTDFPDNIKKITVLYTPHDVPTRAARFFKKIPLLRRMVPVAWGAMGAKGADSIRAHNIKGYKVKGHSDWFLDSKIKGTAVAILDRLTKA
jgi:hypothetical protein